MITDMFNDTQNFISCSGFSSNLQTLLFGCKLDISLWTVNRNLELRVGHQGSLFPIVNPPLVVPISGSDTFAQLVSDNLGVMHDSSLYLGSHIQPLTSTLSFSS